MMASTSTSSVAYCGAVNAFSDGLALVRCRAANASAPSSDSHGSRVMAPRDWSATRRLTDLFATVTSRRAPLTFGTPRQAV
jgi:hypothetical protein